MGVGIPSGFPPARVADVAIRDERIAAIEENLSDSADHVIDTEGKIVASGFIDIHTHSNFILPSNPKAEGKIRQGVTTEVVGNCAFSVAPELPEKVEVLRRYLSVSAPWLPVEETNFAEYIDAWPDLAVNTIMQVVHNTLRLMAMRILVRCMSKEDVRRIASEPTATVGSDGPCVSPYGVTGQGKPHPRLYGTFPRLIGRYARDLGLRTLPQALHNMTGMAATALGLVDQGVLSEGFTADVVVFDADGIIDEATFDEPHTYPSGIVAVIGNVVQVVDGEHHTDALPGHLLRRRGSALQ